MVETVSQEPAQERPDLIRLMDYPDSTEEIPTIDMTDYRAGVPDAKKRIADLLRETTEAIGFFYLTGHGIPQSVFDQLFAQSRRFHEQPMEVKKKTGLLAVDTFRSGYRVKNEGQTENAKINLNEIPVTKPNLTAAFGFNRVSDADDASRPEKNVNVWPENLPGFRETMTDYGARLENLARSFLPLWAASLDLPEDYFAKFFKSPHLTTQLLWYPPQPKIGDKQYGIAPHADNALMTFLVQGNVPGLAVQMPSGHWRIVDVMPGTILINTGNTMVRWTNGRYLSTKHRVINTNTVDRYSVATHFGPSLDAMIECLPSCCGPTNPPRFEPVVYRQYRDHFYGY